MIVTSTAGTAPPDLVGACASAQTRWSFVDDQPGFVGQVGGASTLTGQPAADRRPWRPHP
jgi:hypothetical protein